MSFRVLTLGKATYAVSGGICSISNHKKTTLGNVWPCALHIVVAYAA